MRLAIIWSKACWDKPMPTLTASTWFNAFPTPKHMLMGESKQGEWGCRMVHTTAAHPCPLQCIDMQVSFVGETMPDHLVLHVSLECPIWHIGMGGEQYVNDGHKGTLPLTCKFLTIAPVRIGMVHERHNLWCFPSRRKLRSCVEMLLDLTNTIVYGLDTLWEVVHLHAPKT